MLLARSLNEPELMMDESDGKAFTGALQNVLRHYSVETSQKALDWAAFAGCCSTLYGIRFAARAVRIKREKAAARGGTQQPAGPAPSAVYPLHPLGGVPDGAEPVH